jgi:hypothetical protein
VHQQVRNGAAIGSLLRQQNDTVSVSVMRLNGLGDHEVESPTRQMSFRLPLAVVVVDRNNAVAKATIDANGVLGAVIGPPL